MLDCVKTYAIDDLISHVPAEGQYVVTDDDLNNFINSKLVIYFPSNLGIFFDLIALINHLTQTALPEYLRNTYQLSARSFSKAERGNTAFAKMSD